MQWAVGGVSLGGHATWFALSHEPRLRVGIPIIGAPSPTTCPRPCHSTPPAGCSDYLHLMSRRANNSGIAFEPPYIPASFLAYVRANDPPYSPYTQPDTSHPFFGKQILVLSGADDPIVPWESSEEFVKNLEVGPGGTKKVIVYPGVAHKCTDDMIKETSEFVWEHILSKA